uniref:Uncharacterized protein n=1 Tax=Oryza punctata TaxID=4537 RepID=A0A0E0MA95_ORYPU
MEIMELIADEGKLRSASRSWRADVAQTPALLLPTAQVAGSADECSLSIVVDVRDTSCHLSHLATGATAGSTWRAAGDDWHRPMQPCWEVRMNPAWKRSFRHDPEHAIGDKQIRITIKFLWYFMFLESDLQFSHFLRFAVHVPADTPLAASTDGMLIMMEDGHGFLPARRRRLDEAGQPHRRRAGACLQLGRLRLLTGARGTTAVIDATTLEVLDLVDVPPETYNISTKLLGTANGDDTVKSLDYLHLVALPSKLLVVRMP